MNRCDIPPKSTALIKQSINVLFRTLVADSGSRCPKRMDDMVDPPAETKTPKAVTKFMKGNVMASPEMAIAPTPCPMKILSMMLYREVSVMPIMAGMEYWISNFPKGALPNMDGLFVGIA